MALKISKFHTPISCRKVYDFLNTKLILDIFSFARCVYRKTRNGFNKNLYNPKFNISSYEMEYLLLCTYNPNEDHTKERTAVGDPSDSTAEVSFKSPVEFRVSG
jgi:hypothetical protein